MPLAIILNPDVAIEPVIDELDRQNVAHHVVENGHQLELWVDDPALIHGVQQYYQAYCGSRQHALSLKNLKRVPVTTLILCITFLVALITQLGEQNREWFFMAQMQYDPRDWYLYEGLQNIWRSISPIFLHFSVEHLIFNSLTFWYLGGMLERITGRFFYTALVLVLAIVGNISQLLASGPLFGGLSGVVYGFIGIAFIYQLKVNDLGIPKGLFYVSIGWLLLGVSGVFSAIGLFNVANAAHVGGLLSGLVMAVLYLAWLKVRVKVKNEH
jgi:GlpG protein